MDKEEQKIAIIIIIGNIAPRCISELEHRNDSEGMRRTADIYLGHYPDYTEDLNAMHEAEKVLTPAQYEIFALHLGPLTKIRQREYISANAKQRAEAFLRTLGKWKE